MYVPQTYESTSDTFSYMHTYRMLLYADIQADTEFAIYIDDDMAEAWLDTCTENYNPFY